MFHSILFSFTIEALHLNIDLIFKPDFSLNSFSFFIIPTEFLENVESLVHEYVNIEKCLCKMILCKSCHTF